MPKNSLKLILTLLFWAGIVASSFVMLIELAPKTGGWPYWDKVQHIVGFAVLTLFGYFAYPEKKVWLFSGLAIFGAAIEFLQRAYTFTRMATWGDWVADIVGIVCVFLLINLFKNVFATFINGRASD